MNNLPLESQHQITEKWAKKYNLNLHLSLINASISVPPEASIRTFAWKMVKFLRLQLLVEEITIYDSFLTLLLGVRKSISSDDDPVATDWEPFDGFDHDKFVNPSSEPLKSIKRELLTKPGLANELLATRAKLSKEYVEIKDERVTSRKLLLSLFQPIFIELNKRHIEDREQIKIVAELFITLGYKNAKGKADSKTVHSDIYALKYDIENPPLK